MPGGQTCMVAICKNNAKTSKRNGKSLSFFTFPRDAAMRNEWVSKCYRGDRFDPENKRICSVHFKDEDYEDFMKARIMGTRQNRLKKTAVPSLLLLPEQERTYKLEKEEK